MFAPRIENKVFDTIFSLNVTGYNAVALKRVQTVATVARKLFSSCTLILTTATTVHTVRKEIKCIEGIPRYCTDWFMILYELVHVFPIFV